MESLVSQIQNAGKETMPESKIQTKSMTDKKKTMCEYFRDQIIDEFEGAKDYLTKAIEMKESKPKWACKFYKMAEMEIEHANCLNKMFINMGDSEEPCHDSIYREILEAYTKYMTEISAMERMYKS